jgi:hypothetical protein
VLGEAKEKVVELESLLFDARAQVDSLKSAPIVTNEPECTDCSIFLGDLTVHKEQYASKVEELDVLSVTEPLKLIPYYCLNHTSSPLSNNIEVTCHLCWVKPGKSLTSQDRQLYIKTHTKASP